MSIVLLIEDNADDIMLLRRAMQVHGASFELRIVEVGTDALRLREGGFRPDLIVCDLRLPDTDGARLIAKLREEGPWRDTPILALSSSRRSIDIEDSLGAGAAGFVAKPDRLAGWKDVIQRMEHVLSPEPGVAA